MSNDLMPGSEKLIPIIKAENLSISWLLEGKGSPFLVNSCPTDDEGYALLDELYAEAWTTYLITDGHQISIVLTRPGEYLVKDKPYPYTLVEVLAGNFGRDSLERASKTANGENLYFLETSTSIINDLAKGKIGSYQLLTQILPGATAFTDQAEQKYLQCAETGSTYEVTRDITSTEMETLEALRKINPQNLNHIRAVIHSLADKSGSESRVNKK